MNGLTLAYIGDVYYELCVREYLIEKGFTDVDKLHKKAILFTAGIKQAQVIEYWLDQAILSDDEVTFYKRGRNASGPGRKNIDAKSYHMATGFEALIGGLFYQDRPKARQRVLSAIEYLEAKEDDHGKSGR